MSWKASQIDNNSQFVQQKLSSRTLYNGVLSTSKSDNPSNPAVLHTRTLQDQEDDSKIDGLVKKEVYWPPPQEKAEDQDIQNGQQHQNFQFSETCDTTGNKLSKKFEPPPTVIPLRKLPPITQLTAPIYRSQPAADTIRGGFRMRGDQKWPPPEYKARTELENQTQLELVRGPTFRPLNPKKDYASFFAKNALPNTYPGYKAPPGTQHYSELEMQ